jgi:hypothetical protein
MRVTLAEISTVFTEEESKNIIAKIHKYPIPKKTVMRSYNGTIRDLMEFDINHAIDFFEKKLQTKNAAVLKRYEQHWNSSLRTMKTIKQKLE